MNMSLLNFKINKREVKLREPFKTALRTVESYPVIIFTISDKQGFTGFGECVATPAIVGDSISQIETDLIQVITPALSAVSNLEDGLIILSNLQVAPSSKAAADIALHGYFASRAGLNLAKFLKVDLKAVKTDVTIPLANPSELPKIIQDRVAHGFNSFKIKLGEQEVAENIHRMKIIAESVSGIAFLRIDPNQAWTVDYSAKFLKELARENIEIEYLEQPIAKENIDGLATLSALGISPIMADESLFNISDLDRLLEAKACTWVNIKLLKAGGLAPAMVIAQKAAAHGLKVSVGSMMEGEVGVYAAALLAGAVAPEVTHDLDAAWWHLGGNLSYIGGELEL
jgi:L-alanine-DL-glutamate epimerase-like enolase superfamily enzyme